MAVAFARDDARVALAVAIDEATREKGPLGGSSALRHLGGGQAGDREALAVIGALPGPSGSRRDLDATGKAIAGIAACFEGRPADAVSAFIEAIAGYRGRAIRRRRGPRPHVRRVLPDRPEARAAAAVSREVYVKVGARPMVDRSDAALAGQAAHARAPRMVVRRSPARPFDTLPLRRPWGYSSAGRASEWHSEGPGFESP